MEENSGAPAPASLSEPLNKSGFGGNLFRGEHGLRSGWRLVIYFLIAVVLGAALNLLLHRISGPSVHGVPPPRTFFLLEILNFAIVFAAAWVMSRIEGRSVGEYGLPVNGVLRRNFWMGVLLGLAEITVLMGLIAAFGGYSFGELALRPAGAIAWGLFYAPFFLFVGLFEEFLFRGYTQFTLADGIGFWPAAIALSLLFGAVHLGNKGESWAGAAGVFVVGLLFAFSLRRSGNLWYAIGLHGAFDWGESYLYSVPDSGNVLPGHLSNAVLHGPAWLTGGTVGPEGSVFCFVTLSLQFLVVMWLFPKKKAEEASAATTVEI